MSQITTILRGARETYEIPVLFQHAGAWVEDALTQAGLCMGTMETAEDTVLLLGAPCPELTAAAYSRLIQNHQAIGADFTVFAQTMPARGADDRILCLASDTPPVVCAQKKAAQMLAEGDLVAAVNVALQEGCTVEVVQIPPVTVVTDGLSAFEAQKHLCTRINMG
ncbi:MAG: hypothetical protein Q4A63_05350, partial [Butyricicoccus pullicaecorum]|nr:hypothetical protein [Butyricicoccus pullicaecorum]